MALNLHPEAIKAYDARAAEIVAQVTSRVPPPPEALKSPRPSSLDHRVIPRITITTSLQPTIGSILYDDLGNKILRFIRLSTSEEIGLDTTAYPSFTKLVALLSGNRELSEVLSTHFIEERTFKWIIQTYQRDASIDRSFTAYLIAEARAAVRSCQVLLPIAFLSIEAPFRLGRVRFDYLSKEFWDRYESRGRAWFGWSEEDIATHVARRRKQFQGSVATEVDVTAELDKAVEIARYETDRALMVLRAFSPAVFYMGFSSYIARMGQTFIPTGHYIFAEGQDVTQIHSQQEDVKQTEWLLRNEDLHALRQSGLDSASELISHEPANDFENALVSSLSLFSKAVSAREYEDKLVFILASMETLLLKDANEPIQGALTRRFAMLSADTTDERLRNAKLVTDAYAQRSSYLHHGGSLQGPTQEDLVLLRDLTSRSWQILSRLLLAKSQFSSLAALADYVERLMYS